MPVDVDRGQAVEAQFPRQAGVVAQYRRGHHAAVAEHPGDRLQPAFPVAVAVEVQQAGAVPGAQEAFAVHRVEARVLAHVEQVSLLLRLDALKIIDYRPPHRIRKLTARNFTWRRNGPVHGFFLERILPEFFAAPFAEPEDGFHFLAGMLSDGSMRYIAAEMEKLAREFDTLARHDSQLPLEARNGCSAVLALRKWEYSEFTRIRR